MQKLLKKPLKWVQPWVEKITKWLVSSLFELLKLASVAWTVMYFVTANYIVELILATVIVFASSYFTSKYWKQHGK